MPLKLWLPDYADAGMPSRSASSARTSVTYCKPSSSGIRCSRSWSVGSLIQPSMGMALSGITISTGCLGSHWAGADLTWMENVAQGAVVKNHDLAEIGLNLSKVLDVSPVTNSAVLSIVSACKVLALHLEPVNDGICVLLNRRGEYDQILPFTDLSRR